MTLAQMTLAEYLAALAAHINAIYERLDAMTTNPGMTDAEAIAFAELRAQVATLAERVDGAVSALATLTSVVAGQAERLTGLQSALDGYAQRMAASETTVQTLVGQFGALPELPALPVVDAAGA